MAKHGPLTQAQSIAVEKRAARARLTNEIAERVAAAKTARKRAAQASAQAAADAAGYKAVAKGLEAAAKSLRAEKKALAPPRAFGPRKAPRYGPANRPKAYGAGLIGPANRPVFGPAPPTYDQRRYARTARHEPIDEQRMWAEYEL